MNIKWSSLQRTRGTKKADDEQSHPTSSVSNSQKKPLSYAFLPQKPRHTIRLRDARKIADPNAYFCKSASASHKHVFLEVTEFLCLFVFSSCPELPFEVCRTIGTTLDELWYLNLLMHFISTFYNSVQSTQVNIIIPLVTLS